MSLKLFHLNKISPLAKRAIVGLCILSSLGVVLNRLLMHQNSVLNAQAQEKSDDLSSIQRVKALHAKTKLIHDPIADKNTQRILAQSESPQNGNLKKQAQEFKKVENDNSNEKSCDPYDAALSKCTLSKDYQNRVKLVADTISNATKSQLSDVSLKIDSGVDGVVSSDLKTVNLPISHNNYDLTKNNASNSNFAPILKSPMDLLIASASKTEAIFGRTTDIGGAFDQIKSGTTVLAVLNESKTITSSGEQFASASILGAPFDHKKFPDGVTVLLKLKLNSTQDGIIGQIVSCSTRKNNDKSISCIGQLEDINGESTLRGEVYSNSGWQIITTAATTFLAGLSLSKLTSSATIVGTTVDQSTSNSLYQALSSAITSMGQQISASFARSGTQISIPGRVVVRILFTQDSVW